MLYSNVPARKRHFSSGSYVNGHWVSSRQNKENEDFIKAQRYKQKAIDTMFPDFWDVYSEKLNVVCSILADELNEKLRDLILERGYTNSRNRDYWGLEHKPTYEFANAWEVDVYVGEAGTLHFDLVYHWEAMSVEVPPLGEYNTIEHYSLHAGTFGSSRGQDMRLALADILNMPTTMTYYDSIKTRRGRWQETFLSYCRSEGADRFHDLCSTYGII